jgi:hypothetical protein
MLNIRWKVEKQNLFSSAVSSNDFDGNADENLHRYVIHSMACKAVVMREYSVSC